MKSEMEKEMEALEEAAREARIDPSNPPFRGSVHDYMKQQQAKKKAGKKQQVTARFDQEVIEAFKTLAGEGSYQRLMNQALREWLGRREMLEMVREVMCEELEQALKKSA